MRRVRKSCDVIQAHVIQHVPAPAIEKAYEYSCPCVMPGTDIVYCDVMNAKARACQSHTATARQSSSDLKASTNMTNRGVTDRYVSYLAHWANVRTVLGLVLRG